MEVSVFCHESLWKTKQDTFQNIPCSKRPLLSWCWVCASIASLLGMQCQEFHSTFPGRFRVLLGSEAAISGVWQAKTSHMGLGCLPIRDSLRQEQPAMSLWSCVKRLKGPQRHGCSLCSLHSPCLLHPYLAGLHSSATPSGRLSQTNHSSGSPYSVLPLLFFFFYFFLKLLVLYMFLRQGHLPRLAQCWNYRSCATALSYFPFLFLCLLVICFYVYFSPLPFCLPCQTGGRNMRSKLWSILLIFVFLASGICLVNSRCWVNVQNV